MTPFIQTDAASFACPGMSPARDVTFTLAAGELLVVTGANGSGKSTLLRGLLGLAPLTGGRASLFGTAVQDLLHDQWMELRARCAYASATAPLLSNLTLFDNLAVPLFMRSIAESNARADVERMLARFGLSELAARRPPELLGYKHSLALLARALLLPADLLLIDDPPDEPVVHEALAEACALGKTLLVSTRAADRFPHARVVRLVAPSERGDLLTTS
jgi:molybdate transport system ATP-binding protein